jgi:hypothetical protein
MTASVRREPLLSRLTLTSDYAYYANTQSENCVKSPGLISESSNQRGADFHLKLNWGLKINFTSGKVGGDFIREGEGGGVHCAY